MAGYELPSVSSGVSALMPPASQGVEQRPERHAGRTGFRWGLRALVVGGLAGAAWMLSGAAASAADPASADAATGGLAILSPTQQVRPLVRDLGNGVAERTVTPVIKHVARPDTAPDGQTADRPSHKHPSGPASITPLTGVTHQLTSVVVKPASQLVTTATEVVASTSGTASHGVPGVVRKLTAPLRPTGGPVSAASFTLTRAVTAAPVLRTGNPVTDLLQPAEPVATASGPAQQDRSAAAHVRPAAGSVSSTVTRPTRGGAPPTVLMPAVSSTGTSTAGHDLRTVGGPGTDTRRLADVARHMAATTASSGSVRPAPGSPDPVPVRGHLGAVSGIPAAGSGSPSEGGCAATVPAAVAASTVACHRLPIATDVGVRRYDAESPTASPD